MHSQSYALTKEFNCVTSVIESAMEEVVALKHANSKQMPLFGLPVSLKESIKTKVCDLYT